MFTYQGNKTRELQHIVDNEPKAFKTFVDVFGGSGAVFQNYLRRDDVDQAIYNDIDPMVVGIVETIAKGEEEAAKLKQLAESILPKNKEEFQALKDKWTRQNRDPAVLSCSIGF